MKPEEFYIVFSNKLKSLKRRELIKTILFSSFTFFIIAFVITLISLIIESVFKFPSSSRYILFYLTLFFLGLLFIIIFYNPLKGITGFDKNLSNRNLCLDVGRKFPEIKDKLLNALQVYENSKTNKEGYSNELMEKAIVKAGEDYIALDFHESIDYSFLKKRVKTFLFSFTGIIILSGIFISPFKDSFTRIINPGKEFPVPLPFSILVNPGDKEIVKGDNLTILADIAGDHPEVLTVNLQYEKDNSIRKKDMIEKGENQYSIDLENIRDSFSYFISGKKRENFLKTVEVNSDKYIVDVINPPFIKKIKIRLDYPEYSKLGSRYLEDNIGDITALKGTKAFLEVTANKVLENASIKFDDSLSIKMIIRETKARNDFIITEDKKYHIEIMDAKGIKNKKPIDYWLTSLRDEYPFVQIEIPGQDIDIDENMRVPLLIKINDDFGFSSLKLNFFRVDQYQDSLDVQNINYTTVDLELENKSPQLTEVYHEWDLSGLNLLPEDVIMYFGEVFDNDAVSGPKSSKTSFYSVRFPSVFEIFSEVEEKQSEKINELENIVEESKEIKDKIEEIILDLKRSSTIDWENKKGLEESVQRTEELKKKLEQIREELEEIGSTLEKNNLFSPETMQKYLELQNLFREIMTPEFEQVMDNLKKALEKMDTKGTKQALDQFKLSQEDFLKRIERTTNILKQIQTEQKMDEALRKSETLVKLQNEINEEVQKLKEEDKVQGKTLSEREQKLAENTSDLQQTLEDLLGKMSDNLEMPYKEVGDVIEEMEKMKLNERMLYMSEQIDESTYSEAYKTGEGISGDLSELNDKLKTVKDEMISGQKSKILSVMRKSVHDVLELSKEQETLWNRSKELHQNSNQFEDIAERQNDVLAGLSRITNDLVELSQKTFFVTPEIGKAISDALRSMGNTLRLLEERNGQGASQNQGNALSGLNETAMELRNSMEALANSGSSTGLEEYMKRLEQMAGMQQGINKQTAELPLGKGYTKEQMEMIRRLAAEQETLQRSLSEMSNEMGRRSQLPGRLNGIGKTMEEVINDLKSTKLQERTLRLQERILSRLLDAQRSVRTKDYSKKRESQVGKDYDIMSPEEIPYELLFGRERLREQMIRALDEGYTKDYMELIRKYFEALSKIKYEEAKN